MKIPSLSQILRCSRRLLTCPEEIKDGFRRQNQVLAEGLHIHMHLNAAIDWIRFAHAVNGDGGISKGYNLLAGYWYPSYPETTGYTIPTLLNAAIVLDRQELRGFALGLADYVMKNMKSHGGVAHWADSESDPIVFDTGQVIFGLLAAFDISDDSRYLESACRAGDWLISNQDSSGSWKEFQHLGVEKVIDTRVSWALLELHRYSEQDMYRQAAIHNLEWSLNQQDADGWFRKCAFVEGDDPFTHTLVYAAEGLFESGCLLNEVRYIEAARLTADALLASQHIDGRLLSTYGRAWRKSSRSSCLAGNCQISRLWFRIYETIRDEAYYLAGRKAVTFVASTQNCETPSHNIRGGIAGSYPIYGGYERFNFPNWAAKFFIDALLTLERVENAGHQPLYPG